MNPSRLAELNHQRALVQQQLAWLDREIARENGGSPSPVVARPPTESAISSDLPLAPELEAFRPDPTSTAMDTRRGCLLAVVVVVLIAVAALTAIYFLRYSDRPILFMAEEGTSASASSSSNEAEAPNR